MTGAGSVNEGVLAALGATPRIAIVRALPGLGDFLCAVPAFRALRTALPAARVTLIGLPATCELVARFGAYLDELVEFPGFPGIPEGLSGVTVLPPFLSAMHARRFDLALQLHGSGTTSNVFTLLLGARFAAGCHPPGQHCPDPALFLPYPEGEPEIWRSLRLLEFLGLPLAGDHLEFPVSPEDHAELARLPSIGGMGADPYVCVHPGASVTFRRWTAGGFARLADALAAAGLSVVLTGGAAEVDLTAAIARRMSAPALDLAGRTSLGALAALLQDARLLVCNDTGVSHLAAALRTPSVVVFSASDPARWAPLDRRRHHVVIASDDEKGSLNLALAGALALLREETADVA